MWEDTANKLAPGYLIDMLAPHNNDIDYPLLRLYRCVFLQAVRDACKKEAHAKHMYRSWVLSDDCELICSFIGVPYYDTVQYFKKIAQCNEFRENAKNSVHHFKPKQNNQYTIKRRV